MIGNAVTRDAIPAEPPALDEIRRIVTIFRELRAGMTADGKTKLKSPSGTLSTAEAISVVNNGQALAAHFGDGKLRAECRHQLQHCRSIRNAQERFRFRLLCPFGRNANHAVDLRQHVLRRRFRNALEVT